MRGWKMTAGLVLMATLAALFAPRLLDAPPANARVQPVAPSPTALDTGLAPMEPAVHRPTSTMIPELESVQTRRVLVPTPPVAPTPVPQHMWDDCPGCGMG